MWKAFKPMAIFYAVAFLVAGVYWGFYYTRNWRKKPAYSGRSATRMVKQRMVRQTAPVTYSTAVLSYAEPKLLTDIPDIEREPKVKTGDPVKDYVPMDLKHGHGGEKFAQFWRDVNSLEWRSKKWSKYSYLKLWLKYPYDGEWKRNGIRRDRAYYEQDVVEYVECLRDMAAEWEQRRQKDARGSWITFTRTGDIWRCFGNDGKLFKVK